LAAGGLAILLLAWAWAGAGAQSSPAPPATGKAPARSDRPRYLVFWHSPEKAGERAEEVGMCRDNCW
jgi:hypothetical protein